MDDAGWAGLEQILDAHDLADRRRVRPADIVFGEWVRMKCAYGCPHYGKCAVCPPNNPPVEECRRFVNEYETAVILRFSGAMDDPEDRHSWTKKINRRLFAAERDAFLAGHYKAFVLYVDPCNYCSECRAERISCKHPTRSRPSPEGLGIDVFATVRAAGYDIRVLTETTDTMNRYAVLLVE